LNVSVVDIVTLTQLAEGSLLVSVK